MPLANSPHSGRSQQPAHTYRASLTWSGSTAGGYRAYSREHRISTPPATGDLTVSADSAFRGDTRLPNPEQLLLAAASSCQLLSFLAVAARAGVEVVHYGDDAEATMPVTSDRMRITRIVLHPHIVVASGTDLDLVRRLVSEAHDDCYVANTLNAQVDIEATVEHVEARSRAGCQT